MRRHRRAVVDALAAEHAAHDPWRGPIERIGEPGVLAVGVARLGEAGVFALDPRQDVGRRRDGVLRQAVNVLDVVSADDRRDVARNGRAIAEVEE